MTEHNPATRPDEPQTDSVIDDQATLDRERAGSARRRYLFAIGPSAGAISAVLAALILNGGFDPSTQFILFLSGAISAVGVFLVTARWRFVAARRVARNSAEAQLRASEQTVISDSLPSTAHHEHRIPANSSFLEAWQRYEAALRSVGVLDTAPDGADTSLLPIGELLPQMVSSGAIGSEDYTEVLAMLDLRNRIVHGGEYSQEEVRAGVASVSSLRSALPQSPDNAATGDGIATGVMVRVTGASSTEYGTEGMVKTVRPSWAGKEAVVVVTGILRSREVSIPVTDLSRGTDLSPGPQKHSMYRSAPQAVEDPSH